MNRTILVTLRNLNAAQDALIESAAREKGYDVIFAADDARAQAAAAEAEIIFGASAPLLKCSPNLKWLCVPSAGADQYLKPALQDRQGVLLSNSSGAYGVTIAEHVTMVTLMLMRRQMEYDDVTRARGWRRDLPIRSIRDCRVTLLGTGDIGKEVAIRLRAFGPKKIVGVNRRGRNPGDMFDEIHTFDALEKVLPETDLLVMSLPGTPETKNIMGARLLALMPQDAFLVNVGRGTCLDEAALMDQLNAGRFAGVALDVFQTEPLAADHPLRDCPRLLITPHIAGNMTLAYTRQRIVELFIEDLDNYCAGRPLKRGVALQQGY